MLKNYLVVAWRAFRRNKVYTALNVGGLAVGMTVFLLIGLFADDQLSYDDFHARADRIMTVVVEDTGGSFQHKWMFTPYPLAGALKASVPEVETTVRTKGEAEKATVRRLDGSLARKARVLVADSNFFEVFSFSLAKGISSNVLDAPQHAVLTERLANIIFGEANPVGRSLSIQLSGEPVTVTVAGVSQNPPENSTLQFDVVVPAALAAPAGGGSWNVARWHTYALLDQPMEADAFSKKVRQVIGPHVYRRGFERYSALPLPELYLSDFYEAPGFGGERRWVRFFSAIGLLILLIAAVNYVNLVTAQGERRAKEVGVRRAVGAQREQLAEQFLGETALRSVLALVVALTVVGLTLPSFSAFLRIDLSLNAAWGSGALAKLALFVLAVSLAAGAYPALVLSRFRPVEVLRGRSGSGGGARGRQLRRGLVVFQFAVSAGLILCTTVIYHQLRYMRTKNLGFDGKRVVSVELPFSLSKQRHRALKREVLALPGVARATASQSVPGGFNVGRTVRPDELSSAAQTTSEKPLHFRPSIVDADYIETMGMEFLAGRGFQSDRSTDRTQGYVLNRAAAKAMGWTPEQAVSKPFLFGHGRGAPVGEVLGVVENFHIESLREAVQPVVLMMQSTMFASSPTLSAKLAPGQVKAAMGGIKAVMAEQFPRKTFEYTFLDEKFDAMYRSETQLAELFAVFAGVAVFVACLGLFGLAAFAAERRSKEIAIRKAVGASVSNIVVLISKEFAALVAVALMVGVPVAWWGVRQWLIGFAYHVVVGPATLALVVLAVLLVAGAATNYHAVRAALANPAVHLRDE